MDLIFQGGSTSFSETIQITLDYKRYSFDITGIRLAHNFPHMSYLTNDNLRHVT